MLEIEYSADELISRLLGISQHEPVFILDSCGVGHLGSHLLLAGLRPAETIEIVNEDPDDTLRILDAKLSSDRAAIFTLSYDFGRKVQGIKSRTREATTREPDLFLATFHTLIVHDYDSAQTFLIGDPSHFAEVVTPLSEAILYEQVRPKSFPSDVVRSNFTESDYLVAVEEIRELIRSGETYQTNLTQQLTCPLPNEMKSEQIFARLRRNHPAAFAAFLRRSDSTVVSASPERFFRITSDRRIEASPIKGTRRRGKTPAEDAALRSELDSSPKDRAENTMIVDLVRNDLGRVCKFGSVEVDRLCAIEEHPTLFHLVSTVGGKLRPNVKISEILRAVFPCGSITGAPKIRTMQIIDAIEPDPRELSMGAIGFYMPRTTPFRDLSLETTIDLSVAIRTMTIRDNVAKFNVGGGIVSDSIAELEYQESLLKAKALLASIYGSNDPS